MTEFGIRKTPNGRYLAFAPDGTHITGNASRTQAECQAENARLREAVQVCANKFWEYVIIHEAKGPDGAEKAQRNREMAEMCEEALRTIPSEPLEDQ